MTMHRFVLALAVLGAGAPASAQYIGSVVGLLSGDVQTDSLTVITGDTFSGAVVLSGPDGIQNDFALFRLVFGKAGLEYEMGWFDWSSPYTTGGVDDFSSPSASSMGTIDADTHMDVLAPGEIDVAFENVTDNFGDYFEIGTLVAFTLRVPMGFELGTFTIEFAPDTFAAGTSAVEADAGALLTIDVVPAPSAALMAVMGGVFAARRRRRCSEGDATLRADG